MSDIYRLTFWNMLFAIVTLALSCLLIDMVLKRIKSIIISEKIVNTPQKSYKSKEIWRLFNADIFLFHVC